MTPAVIVSLIWTGNALLACYLLAMMCDIHYARKNERAAHPEFYERYDYLLR